MLVHVEVNERVVLHVDGKPVRWLGPGRHLVLRPFSKVKVHRLNVEALVAELRPEEAALAPATELREVNLKSHERGVVSVAGKPVVWLKPGRHHVLTVDPAVTVEIYDTSVALTRPLDPQVRKLAPGADYVEVTVPEGCVALRYIDGALVDVLPAGRHAAWQTLSAVNLPVVDLRERVLSIQGQEVMTKDRVSLRLNVSVVFHIADPRVMATVAKDADEALYLAAQLAVRDAVAVRTLDTLLATRETLGEELLADVATRAQALGLKVISLGLKDVILPGDIKELMNKVVEAQKVAEANVIMRREETAATRSLAQTAKLLDEQPLLVRLKELEAYKELAGKVGNVHLFLGEDGLPSLQLKVP
ncbi:MAG: slipin family protein [Myxococcota bacterium]